LLLRNPDGKFATRTANLLPGRQICFILRTTKKGCTHDQPWVNFSSSTLDQQEEVGTIKAGVSFMQEIRDTRYDGANLLVVWECFGRQQQEIRDTRYDGANLLVVCECFGRQQQEIRDTRYDGANLLVVIAIASCENIAEGEKI
jgi:hypothetical protein